MEKELYSHYDFIILGEHPAALWGAVILLQQGLKVLIIPFGLQSERNLAPEFALSVLNLDPTLFPDRDQDPIQVLTSERRFRVFSDPQRLNEEHLFVFGKSIEEAQVSSTELWRGLAFLQRGSETGPMVIEDAKTIFKKVGNTIHFSKEPGWLKSQFLARIQQLGGHVLPDGQLQRVFIEKKVLVGIQVEGSSSMLTASQVWVGANWDLAQNFFNEKTSLRSSPIGWSFEIRVELESDALPKGLTSYMIFVQEDAPVIEMDHQGKGRFVLRTMLPFQERFLERSEQRKIAQRLFKLFATFIPDLEYNVKKIEPNIRDPERVESEELRRFYPFHALEEIPVRRLRYGSPGLGAQSPVQNLWFTYEEAYPRFGEWGAHQAVVQAIQAWGKQVQNQDFLKFNAPI